VRGCSVFIAAKSRANWATEIETVVPPDGEPVGLLVGLLVPLLAGLDVELLQAAAARHRASDADATTAPFLTVGII
jgi:hypothetical protein